MNTCTIEEEFQWSEHEGGRIQCSDDGDGGGDNGGSGGNDGSGDDSGVVK